MGEQMCERKRGHGKMFWELLGGVALAAIVAGIIVNFGDIKRYIEISRM